MRGLLAVAVLLALGTFAGCGGESKDAQLPPGGLKEEKPKTEDLQGRSPPGGPPQEGPVQN